MKLLRTLGSWIVKATGIGIVVWLVYFALFRGTRPGDLMFWRAIWAILAFALLFFSPVCYHMGYYHDDPEIKRRYAFWSGMLCMAAIWILALLEWFRPE